MKRQLRLDHIRAIEREYLVAQVAIAALRREMQRDPKLLLAGRLERADAKAFHENLEATYLLRLFSEFESGLRDWWRNGLKKGSKALTYDLIQSIAVKRNIPSDNRDDVQTIRRYRNSLIHEEDENAGTVSIALAKRALCKYYSRLPPDW